VSHGSARLPLTLPRASIRRFGSPRPSSQAGPFSPCSIAIVAAVPATRQWSATTLTLERPDTGQPLRGSRMWE